MVGVRLITSPSHALNLTLQLDIFFEELLRLRRRRYGFTLTLCLQLTLELAYLSVEAVHIALDFFLLLLDGSILLSHPEQRRLVPFDDFAQHLGLVRLNDFTFLFHDATEFFRIFYLSQQRLQASNTLLDVATLRGPQITTIRHVYLLEIHLDELLHLVDLLDVADARLHRHQICRVDRWQVVSHCRRLSSNHVGAALTVRRSRRLHSL